MDYKLLFILIEGDDDERFFESVVEPFLQERYSVIKFWQYAEENGKRKVNFIKSINSMKADYICVGDIDDVPCITAKKEKITDDFGKKITTDKIVIVIREIEGWYLAGLDKKASKKIGIRKKIGTTDNITKEYFNQLIPKKMPRPEFMQKILGNYSCTQNHYQWTSLCRNYPVCVRYYNQTRNLTAECAEGRGGDINGYRLCVPLRPPRLFFLPEDTGSQSEDRSTYLSSYNSGKL
ncbi:MAG: hypothetical protein U9N09_00165 [Euryarchaeota archaeon]|nr:hypothetical protein [Euryarchaeota archaeon]